MSVGFWVDLSWGGVVVLFYVGLGYRFDNIEQMIIFCSGTALSGALERLLNNYVMLYGSITVAILTAILLHRKGTPEEH